MNRREFIQASSLSALAGALPATAAGADAPQQPPPQESGLIAYWPFDEVKDSTTTEKIRTTQDTILGCFSLVKGVRGNGLKCDGFTTRIPRDHQAPSFQNAVTFTAWVAPQAYPWNWCAIVAQEGRYFFGVDATGHVGLRLLIDKQWEECVSGARIQFMQWSHIAASFNPGQGIAVYVNGQNAGRLEIRGHLARDGGKFQIARNLHEIPAAASRKIPASYSFDGILDELKIYDRALDPDEIKTAYESLRPSEPPALTWRKLPQIPNTQKRFGAYYTALKFSPEWDELWRIDKYPDIVVAFDGAAYKMVFWHGTTYNMNLVTENGRWVGDQSAEDWPDKYGCVEHMSDKQCRYSHVRLIENGPARVVVHWRYAMVDVLYNIGYPNPITNWGDWTDEYYTIYPDGLAVRHFLIHGTRDTYSITEPATLNNPGEKAEDNVAIGAATLANMKGEARTFSWETWPSDGKVESHFYNEVPDANIAMVNTKSEFKPVFIYEPGTLIIPYGGGAPSRPWFSKFPTWNHWPVAQIPSDGRDALALDRVSSSAILSPEPPQIHRKTGGPLDGLKAGALEGRFLMGLTNRPVSAMLPVARAWLEPPVLDLHVRGFTYDGYSRNDRAYHLRRLSEAEATLDFTLDASEQSPMVNPGFVVEGWGERKAVLRRNGKLLAEGANLRMSHIREVENPTLVVWLRAQITKSAHFTLSPA